MAKKKQSASRKRQEAAARRRQARVEYVRRQAANDDGGYWHGGLPGLEPGTILVGAEEARASGIDTAHYRSLMPGIESTPYDPSLVYFSSRREFARGFAAQTAFSDRDTGVVYQRGSLYRVEPIGEVRPDPDFAGQGVSWCAPRARIVAVEEPNVLLDEFGSHERIGPFMSWSDGSPIYDSGGFYQPSPEQRAAGFVPDWIGHLPPWTPLSIINAAIQGVPSGVRPDKLEHAAITCSANEPVDVLLRHRERAARLLLKGVEFHRSGGVPDSDQLAELIAPVVLREDDPRGVCVAVHPRDGVIGACVVTAMLTRNQTVMFIDHVVVSPAWRNRGLGSVLLLTAQQMMPAKVDFSAGHCDPDVAPFFAQMGYTVLKEDVPLIVPVYEREEDIRPLQAPGHSMFYRQGPF